MLPCGAGHRAGTSAVIPARRIGGTAADRAAVGADLRAAAGEQLADIAEFDRAEGWRGDGAVSMINWVTAQCGVSTRPLGMVPRG